MVGKQGKGYKAHEKMFNITNHQGHANQNHNEISPHICQSEWLSSKRTKITNFGEDKGRVKGALLQSWWEYKLVQPLWKTIWYGSFSKTKNLIVI